MIFFNFCGPILNLGAYLLATKTKLACTHAFGFFFFGGGGGERYIVSSINIFNPLPLQVFFLISGQNGIIKAHKFVYVICFATKQI